MGGAATLGALRTHGYRVSLDLAELVVRGPGPVPDDLRREIVADTAGLKAAVLLADPPGWLAKLLDLHRSGRETEVRRTDTSGKAKLFAVKVSLKNVCAAVAAEIGAPVLEWELLRPEVEDALGRWSK